jgi:hypothetical protein
MLACLLDKACPIAPPKPVR